MSNVWFISDPHFGHRRISEFRNHVTSEEHNRQIIVDDWKSYVTKRDTVYVLGDVAFTKETLDEVGTLPGKKLLIRGNHDNFTTKEYLDIFEEVYGLVKYKEFWLSHAPIHPDELRGKRNIHGHVHYSSIQDQRYINVCVEALFLKGYPSLISIEQIRSQVKCMEPLNEDTSS